MSVSGWVLGLWLSGVGLPGALPAEEGGEPSRGADLAPAEARSRCHADLERVLAEAARFSSLERRAQALLAGLSTACEGVLPTRLREGAGEAASARRRGRARRLLDAARGSVSEDCVSAAAVGAWEVEARCPPPGDTLFVSPLPRSLDAGSYAFALAVRARLRERGAYDARAQRWVAEFLLRTALEGETARTR